MTRSASAATLLTLWSTSSTARPSSRNARIRSEKALISAARQAGERLVDQHHLGIARHRLRQFHAAQIGEGQRPWMPLQARRRARRVRRWRVRARSTAAAVASRSSESGNSASLMFSSTVCRCSGRECWKTMLMPARAMRCAGQPAMSMPSSLTAPALARTMPMISDITVDLPEPFGPISPTISPAREVEAHILDRDHAAEALAEAADLQARPRRSFAFARGAARNRAARRGRTG